MCKINSTKIRVKILRLLAAGSPTVREVQEHIEAASTAATQYHLDQLQADGLVARSRGKRSLVLTTQGQMVLDYCEAASAPESALERKGREKMGAWSAPQVRAVARVAEALDQSYALTREGLHRKTTRGHELERKVTTSQLLDSLKTCTTIDAAAASLNLAPKTIRERLDSLLGKAMAELEARNV